MWYLITWFDTHGDALRCEVLHRASISHVWAFVSGRNQQDRLPTGAAGFWIREALPMEIIDEDIGEARTPSNHAANIDVWDNAPQVLERVDSPYPRR